MSPRLSRRGRSEIQVSPAQSVKPTLPPSFYVLACFQPTIPAGPNCVETRLPHQNARRTLSYVDVGDSLRLSLFPPPSRPFVKKLRVHLTQNLDRTKKTHFIVAQQPSKARRSSARYLQGRSHPAVSKTGTTVFMCPKDGLQRKSIYYKTHCKIWRPSSPPPPPPPCTSGPDQHLEDG